MSTAGKPAAEPIFLPEAEDAATRAPYAARIAEMEARGIEVPQILYLLAYKPAATDHLCRFSQEVMRGPSPLEPGERELIAAFTSARNQCLF